MSSSYNIQNADIRVKINNEWCVASEEQRSAYIAYKSRNHYYRETPHADENGITIFRDSINKDDPYMPTYFKLTNSLRSGEYPIIDMNDIYIFLMEGVSGNGSRSGAGWVKSRNYQAWAYIDFMYDFCTTRKCYMSKYSTYLAFPPGFDTRNVVTIDIDDLPPNIIFSMSRNDNNSVYYEKNDGGSTRVRICDNEYARSGFLGFYTRITMDVGMVVIPPSHNDGGHSYSDGDVSISSLEETTNEDEQCILCYNYKKDIQYTPCNHTISCYKCFERLIQKECPVCKIKISKIKKCK
jgi:hypothetical protein